MGCCRGTYGEKRNAYKVMVLKPERNDPHETTTHRWDNSIKMDLKQVGLVSMHRTVRTQDWHRWQTVVNVVMTLGLT